MQCMKYEPTKQSEDTTQVIPHKKQGYRLENAERLVIIGKLIDELCSGYMSTYALSKKLRLSRQTIEAYRPIADKLIREKKLDRNVIRNLQVQRTYKLIEMLMDDLSKCQSIKERALIYNQIYKFSSHLALITGLNVETTVHVDPTKLVIIRANPNKKEVQANITEVDSGTVAGVTEVE